MKQQMYRRFATTRNSVPPKHVGALEILRKKTKSKFKRPMQTFNSLLYKDQPYAKPIAAKPLFHFEPSFKKGTTVLLQPDDVNLPTLVGRARNEDTFALNSKKELHSPSGELVHMRVQSLEND